MLIKWIFLPVLLFLTFFRCFGQSSNTEKHHNKIDGITTSFEIENLLKSLNKEYGYFKTNDSLKFADNACQKLSDSLKVKFYTKVDFDNNNYTDLLVIGEWEGYNHSILCILDSGENNFFVKSLTRRSFQDCTFPVVLTKDNKALINYFGFKEHNWPINDTVQTIESKKLIYKFGDFVEYNDSVVNDYNIQEIKFETTECFGTCPIFSLIINSDRSTTYEAIKYNVLDGKFTSKVDRKSYSELIALLNYINFPNLCNSYRVNWTDDQSCTLKIIYSNGGTKIIKDYGLIGTYGLERVYNMLFNLRNTQKWSKV